MVLVEFVIIALYMCFNYVPLHAVLMWIGIHSFQQGSKRLILFLLIHSRR